MLRKHQQDLLQTVNGIIAGGSHPGQESLDFIPPNRYGGAIRMQTMNTTQKPSRARQLSGVREARSAVCSVDRLTGSLYLEV
jgi:hypothetical protein